MNVFPKYVSNLTGWNMACFKQQGDFIQDCYCAQILCATQKLCVNCNIFFYLLSSRIFVGNSSLSALPSYNFSLHITLQYSLKPLKLICIYIYINYCLQRLWGYLKNQDTRFQDKMINCRQENLGLPISVDTYTLRWILGSFLVDLRITLAKTQAPCFHTMCPV